MSRRRADSGGQEANWKPPPKDHPHRLKRMESIKIQSYKPTIITENRQKLEDACRDLVVNNDHIHVVEQRLRACINAGLGKETHDDATIKCFPTYVSKLPTGQETGRFLALDLGGTNFRVLQIDIGDNKQFKMESKVFAIPSEIMIGTGDQLFDHIVNCLWEFCKEYKLCEERLPLGFTFSFPCRQEGLAKGTLTNWTKGFKCSGVEGEDVVELLKRAIDRYPERVQIDVCALLNDTTGCLMSCAWKEDKCRIGLILGTGTNACYLENIDAIETVDSNNRLDDQMIVNTEWGAFGDNKELDFIRTDWDKAVDSGSLNPGKQTFEKMISGMYMGELTRQVLVDMYWENLIFQNIDADPLFEWGNFHTRYLSEIESDPVGDFTRCREVFAELFGADQYVTDEDCSATRYICELVSRRAGFMAAAGITALLKKMDYKDVVVAIDGSVFRYHPHFPNIMRSRIQQLMGIDYKFDLMLSTDGSGRGAALVAAVLSTQNGS